MRFLAKDNAFAALRHGFKKIGKVDDISINGLGFSFLSEITQVDSDDHHTQVDIFSSEDGFYLSNVPCRIVYETPDTTFDKSFLLQMYRCGLHFEKLTKTQSDLLKSFITKHTKGVL